MMSLVASLVLPMALEAFVCTIGVGLKFLTVRTIAFQSE